LHKSIIAPITKVHSENYTTLTNLCNVLHHSKQQNVKISPVRDWQSAPEWLSSTHDLDFWSGHTASLIDLYLENLAQSNLDIVL